MDESLKQKNPTPETAMSVSYIEIQKVTWMWNDYIGLSCLFVPNFVWAKDKSLSDLKFDIDIFWSDFVLNYRIDQSTL